MKFHLLLMLSFAFSSHLFAQKDARPSQVHRKGLYQYVGESEDILIKRTKHRQIEYNPKTKQKLVLSIKWVSDNEYVLKFIRHHNMPGCLKKGYTIASVITLSDQDSYTCKWSSDHCGSGVVQIRRVK